MILNKICKIILIMPLILTGFNTQAQGSYYNQFAKRHTQYMSFGISTASYSEIFIGGYLYHMEG